MEQGRDGALFDKMRHGCRACRALILITQSATDENTNGLLRRYFPKLTELSTRTAEDLRTVEVPSTIGHTRSLEADTTEVFARADIMKIGTVSTIAGIHQTLLNNASRSQARCSDSRQICSTKCSAFLVPYTESCRTSELTSYSMRPLGGIAGVLVRAPMA